MSAESVVPRGIGAKLNPLIVEKPPVTGILCAAWTAMAHLGVLSVGGLL
ncbi:hypothetical protein [Nocardia wallacei]|nr:hypothetical protein [Nocardia wallacei]